MINELSSIFHENANFFEIIAGNLTKTVQILLTLFTYFTRGNILQLTFMKRKIEAKLYFVKSAKITN